VLVTLVVGLIPLLAGLARLVGLVVVHFYYLRPALAWRPRRTRGRPSARRAPPPALSTVSTPRARRGRGLPGLRCRARPVAVVGGSRRTAYPQIPRLM
jgi:hypothetical protein